MTEPFIISRNDDAKVDLHYKVQPDPDQMAQGMGPEGFQVIGGHSLRPGAMKRYEPAAADELATFDGVRAGMAGGFTMMYDKVAAHLQTLKSL